MFVQTTAQDMHMKLCHPQDGQTPERRARICQSKMLKGDLRGAVKYLSQAEKGGVLLPYDLDVKSGLTIKAVLQSKHPYTTTPHKSTIHQYELMPDFINKEITQETVEQVAHNLSGYAGLGVVDSHAVSHWMLAFGNASETSRHSLANFANWLANNLPPWAAYRVMWSGRLLALVPLGCVPGIPYKYGIPDHKIQKIWNIH
jgi:hypothetical protein